MSSASKIRCPWCPVGDRVYELYHDLEWGVPIRDGRMLFELLNLEGAQAGLSWRTVLGKRETYREVFENFDPAALVLWSEEKIATALTNPGIIRNRLKVRAVIRNAQALQTHFSGDLNAFARFLWSFVEGQPVQKDVMLLADYPARTEVSDRLSVALKKLDFTFVGSTICYAFMQATGMVNDHARDCFRRPAVRKLGLTWRI